MGKTKKSFVGFIEFIADFFFLMTAGLFAVMISKTDVGIALSPNSTLDFFFLVFMLLMVFGLKRLAKSLSK